MPVMLALHCRVSLRSALPLLIVPAICLIATQARAQSAEGQQQGDWQVMLGAGGIYAPDFEGSDEFEFQPFPFVSVEYRELAYIRGPETGVNIIRLKPTEDFAIKAGPVVRYRRDRKEKRNKDLRGLGDVGTAIEAGGALSFRYRQAWVRLSLAKDVAGGDDTRIGR